MPRFDIDKIPAEFVDADFRKWNYAKGDLGIRANEPELFGAYENSQPMLTEAECREVAEELERTGGGLERLVTRIFNQGREGSCVGNAGTQGHQVKQAQQFGKANVIQLSAVSLYQLIGRSPSSGAYVPDALTKSRDVGILPLDTPENRARFGVHVMPHTGFYSKRQPGWEEVAGQFRVLEAFKINTFLGLISAQLSGHPVVVGRQGHSILYLRPIFKNGRWHNLYVNSWGDWGVGAGDFRAGFGMDTESQMRLSASGCYAICSASAPFTLAA